ncbi:MAG: hypothetical protein HZB99_04320 [Candidatus Harrisonbacteria bacterium]|nr:hypothetical protein [Candidatus Harrisonbacteria bacterium]
MYSNKLKNKMSWAILSSILILLNSFLISFAANIVSPINGKCEEDSILFKFEPAVKEEAGTVTRIEKCIKKGTREYEEVFKNAKRVGDAYEASAKAYEDVVNGLGIFGTLGDIKEGVKTYEVKYDIPCSPIFGGDCPKIAGGEGATPGRYIVRIYQFGLMIVGLLAFGSITFGALQYILAAGSFTSIDEAKEQIRSAIYGLILLLGAATILYTIDPGFLNIINPGANNPELFITLQNVPPPAVTTPPTNKPKETNCPLPKTLKDGNCICPPGQEDAVLGGCQPVIKK